MKEMKQNGTRTIHSSGKNPLKKHPLHTSRDGFTIVELLIVVVVIAILAAITIVSFNGITQRAKQTTVLSDASNAASAMVTDNIGNGSYSASPGSVNGGRGIQVSPGNSYSFYSTATTFCITVSSSTSGVNSYYVSNTTTSPTLGVCAQDLGAPVVNLAGDGTSGYVNGTGAAARVFGPTALAADAAGGLYFSDSSTSRIRKATTAGVVTFLAGSGASSYAEGTGTGAVFNWPQAITVGPAGVLYIADTNNSRIRALSTANVSSLVAGGTQGVGDGTGSAARFNTPRGIVYDSVSGFIYVADSQSHVIRRVTTGGVVTTFAGTTSTGGYIDATGTAARFNYPQGLAVDSAGVLYVADTLGNRIRKVTSAGVVTTLAGNGTAGFANGTGTAAQFNNPWAIAVAADGTVYVADTNNDRIRKITPAGVVTTLAGSGVAGFADGTGTDAQFNKPAGIAIGSDGKLYVTDKDNHRLRTLDI